MNKSERRFFIIAGCIVFFALAYFVSVIIFCVSGNDILKSIGEWMLLIPMIVTIVIMVLVISLMISDAIRSKRKESNSK